MLSGEFFYFNQKFYFNGSGCQYHRYNDINCDVVKYVYNNINCKFANVDLLITQDITIFCFMHWRTNVLISHWTMVEQKCTAE